MSIMANKLIATDYFACCAEGRYVDALRNFADNMVWWVVGSDRHGGSHGKAALLDTFIHMLPKYFPNGCTPTIEQIVAEGDWVVCIGRNEAELGEGKKPYSNPFVWVFKIEDGLVTIMREYFDTAHAAEVLLETSG